MIIAHGEDIPSSYKWYAGQIEAYKDRGRDVITKDVSELDPSQLRQLTSPGLFESEKVIIIKNLLSGTKSKAKEALIDVIKQIKEAEIILYETKKLTPSQLKSFTEAKIETFNINPVIFKFLDMLHPGNTMQLLTGWNRLLELAHEPEYIFAMLMRQIRLLLQAKSGPSYLKLAPYPKRLIIAQANYYSLDHLLDLHRRLYEIDKKIKTGTSSITIGQLMPGFLQNV